MSRISSQHLANARLAFFIFLTPCIFLAPQIFREDLGLSNYGINPSTIVFYFLGFLSSVLFLALASNILLAKKSATHTKVAWSLRIIAVLQLALLLVPDSKNDNIRHLHVNIGLTLFMAEFLFGWWLVFRSHGKALDWFLAILQSLAGISAYLSLLNILKLEAPSQMVFQLSFMTLCVESVRRMEKPKFK